MSRGQTTYDFIVSEQKRVRDKKKAVADASREQARDKTAQLVLDSIKGNNSVYSNSPGNGGSGRGGSYTGAGAIALGVGVGNNNTSPSRRTNNNRIDDDDDDDDDDDKDKSHSHSPPLPSPEEISLDSANRNNDGMNVSMSRDRPNPVGRVDPPQCSAVSSGSGNGVGDDFDAKSVPLGIMASLGLESSRRRQKLQQTAEEVNTSSAVSLQHVSILSGGSQLIATSAATAHL